MTDDRWHMKGRDRDVFNRFRKRKREYDEQRDERVTDERALELLMDGVPVKREGDTKEILERLEDLHEACESGGNSATTEDVWARLNDVYDEVEQVKQAMR